MRILNILNTCARGGTETLLLDVFNSYDRKEMKIWFCTFQGGDLENSFRNSDINFIKIPRNLPVDLFTIIKLRNLIKLHKIDIVHTHILVDNFHAYFAILGLRVKLVHSYHGYDYENDLRNNLIQRTFISLTDANIFVSKAVQKYYCDKFNPSNKSYVVYNGVDPIKMAPTGKNIRQELGINDNVPLLGMVGNFTNTVRDHITVCKALIDVIRERPEIHCVFVGKKSDEIPHYYDQVVSICKKNNIQNNVHFIGTRSDVPDILHALDLYVYASNHDTFGISLVEAMMCGIPVIANDLPPFLEISDNGKFIDLYKTKNASDLSDKILSKLETNNNASDAKHYVEQNFTIQKHIESLMSVYKKVLN